MSKETKDITVVVNLDALVRLTEIAKAIRTPDETAERVMGKALHSGLTTIKWLRLEERVESTLLRKELPSEADCYELASEASELEYEHDKVVDLMRRISSLRADLRE